MPFTIAPKNEIRRYKYNKICSETTCRKYRTIMKEFKEDLNKWRNILCLWVGRLSIINMSGCPHLMYRFSAIQIKIPVSYFVDIDKLMLKLIWKGK